MQPSPALVAQRLRLRVRFLVYTQRTITIGEIASRTGYSQPAISNILSGKRKLSPELAASLMHITGVRLADMFARGDLRRMRQWMEQQCETPDKISA